MKNQYFGDINDYRKYGLLRALAGASRLRVGVCWLLTSDDDGRDGESRAYLTRPGKWRRYDPPLYDALSRLLPEGNDRSVRLARSWDLVAGAEYYDRILTDGAKARQEYFPEAWEQLSGCDILFLDPDNGIEVSNPLWGGRGSAKYIYWRELNAAFARGHSLLIYQHYPRAPRERFVPFLADRIAQELGCSRVSAFKTPHVVFFLAQREEHLQALKGVAPAVAARWPSQIDPWPNPLFRERSEGASGGEVGDAKAAASHSPDGGS